MDASNGLVGLNYCRRQFRTPQNFGSLKNFNGLSVLYTKVTAFHLYILSVPGTKKHVIIMTINKIEVY